MVCTKITIEGEKFNYLLQHMQNTFSAKLYGNTVTVNLPSFRMECGRTRQHGLTSPNSRVTKYPRLKKASVIIIIFTCTTSRPLHLNVTKMQTAEKFQQKQVAIMTHQTRLTRPTRMVSNKRHCIKQWEDHTYFTNKWKR